MTIIVTGGAGFIGSNFIFYMMKAHPDYRLVCLDKLTYAGNLSTQKSVLDMPSFRFVRGDICDRELVYSLFDEEHPDAVVNFAAESHVDRSILDPSLFLQTNIIGTSVLMDAARRAGNIRFHQISTDEVYGDLPLDRKDLFFTETTPLHTSSPYSFPDSLFKRCLRKPAKLAADLVRINRIPEIMALAVFDKCDEILALSQLSEDYADNVNVAHLIVSAHIVDFPYPSLVENQVDGAAVVLHIEPVTHIDALSIDRKAFALQCVDDHQRNELFRKMVRPIIV